MADEYYILSYDGADTDASIGKQHEHANKATLDNVQEPYTTVEKDKLDAIEANAETNNISDANATDLTDAGNSSLHYHSTDRARANHSGTQLAITISDFDSAVAGNSAIADNTTHRGSDGKDHSDVGLNNAHRADVTTNPHSVSKTAVGLSAVPNTDCTNASNISSGTLDIARLPALTTDNVSVVTDKKYVTDADLVLLGNTSNTNSGDQDISGIATNAGAITNIEAKTDFISVSQAVDLDAIESDTATNTSHKTSNGSDHTYIDQDVKVTANPTFAGMTSTDDVNMSDKALINLKQIIFDNTPVTPGTAEGTVYWNGQEHTLDIVTGLGPVLQAGLEMWVLVYNGTGVEIGNGKAVHSAAAVHLVGDFIIPQIELAKADNFDNCYGTLLVTTQVLTVGGYGFATRFGRVRGIDTTALTVGGRLWVSPTDAGEFVNTKPQFPDYALSVGGVLSSVEDGELQINQTTTIQDTLNDAWDGAIRETFDFRITSTGGVITGEMTNPATSDRLTCIFSTGFYNFEPNGDVVLTAGTATVPQTNYVYIDIADKLLKTSTTEFPSTEHCKVAQVALLDATLTETNGALRNQNLNDHIKTAANNGHILHMAERIRQFNAEWNNGIEGSLSGAPTDLYIATTSGKVWQMHKHSFLATDMSVSDDAHIVNDFITPYGAVSNLNGIDSYSTGAAWNNEWANIVVWGVANKTGEESHIMVNLPSSGYNSEASAIADTLSITNYTIPSIFKGVGFLIARFTIRVSGAVFTYNPAVGYQDLRGFIPNSTAGSGTGGGGVTSILGLIDTPSSYVDQAGKILAVNTGETAMEFIPIPTEPIMLTCSDEITDITAGASILTFRIPYAFELVEVRASVNIAPLGSSIIVDINESGTTILSTKLSIDVSEKTSTTSVIPVVISDGTLADDAEITIDVDQVGSGTAGTGLKVTLIGRTI